MRFLEFVPRCPISGGTATGGAIAPAAPGAGSAQGITRVGAGSPSARRLYQRLAVGVAVTDALMIVAALALARVILHGTGPVHLAFITSLLLGPVGGVAIFSGFGLYRLSRL